MMLYLKQERKQLLMGLGVVMYVCTHVRTHTYTLLPVRSPETESEVSLAQDQCEVLGVLYLIFPVTLGKGAFCQNGREN